MIEFNYRFHENADPRSNLTVYLSGLSITTLVDKKWKSTFLETNDEAFDRQHALRIFAFEQQNGTVNPIKQVELAEHVNCQRFVEIIADLETSTTRYFSTQKDPDGKLNPRDISHIGDFSGEEFHGENVSLALPTKEPKSSLTEISIPGGTVYTAAFAEYCVGEPDIYQVLPANNSRKPRILGKWIGIDLQCKNGDVSIKSWNDGVSPPIEAPLTLTPDSRLIIVIDNLCGNSTEEDDFPYYYQEHGGVLAHETLELKMVSEPSCAPGHKVACNAMIAQNLR